MCMLGRGSQKSQGGLRLGIPSMGLYGVCEQNTLPALESVRHTEHLAKCDIREGFLLVYGERWTRRGFVKRSKGRVRVHISALSSDADDAQLPRQCHFHTSLCSETG